MGPDRTKLNRDRTLGPFRPGEPEQIGSLGRPVQPAELLQPAVRISHIQAVHLLPGYEWWRSAMPLCVDDNRDIADSAVELLRLVGHDARACYSGAAALAAAPVLGPDGREPTLKAFSERKFALLMGDYSDREVRLVPLVFYTKLLAFRAGLRQACTDIIRFGHGASSGKKVYRDAFIPGLHDVRKVFERSAS